MQYHQNSAGHGGKRCETERKTEIEIHGYHQKIHQEEWADGRQHSRPQELEIGSFQGDSLTWKSLQGEKRLGIQHVKSVDVTYGTREPIKICECGRVEKVQTEVEWK